MKSRVRVRIIKFALVVCGSFAVSSRIYKQPKHNGQTGRDGEEERKKSQRTERKKRKKNAVIFSYADTNSILKSAKVERKRTH